jgi:hypothetical protein
LHQRSNGKRPVKRSGELVKDIESALRGGRRHRQRKEYHPEGWKPVTTLHVVPLGSV